MSFIDNLGIELDALILVTAVVFYTAVWSWYQGRDNRPAVLAQLRGGSWMLGALGGFLLLLGLWGEFTWPLPAAYNLLFYDPTVLIGLVLLGFYGAIRFELPTHYVGVFAFVSGWGVIYYGLRAYQLGLTQEPFDMMGMFVAFGAMAVLALPVTLYLDRYVLDRLPLGPKGASAPSYPMAWNLLIGLFLLVAVVAGVASILMGFNTSGATSPPRP
ncbi:membrane protein containing DUF981, partial [mine drainage metagenome]